MARASGFVYLASASPRRAALLEQIGIRFEPLIATADEDSEALEALEAGESARRYVQRVTVLKAGAAVLRQRERGLPKAPILTADTTVVLARQILGKPRDGRHARAMLRQLQGTSHRVLTAVAVTDGRRLELALSESQVTLCSLSAAQIAAYVASGESEGKAGAYGIQGRAAAFIASMRGSYSGIMGLPLYETAALLTHFGVSPRPCAEPPQAKRLQSP